MRVAPRLMPSLRIVPAAEADFEAVASLINAAFATHPILGGRDRTSAESVAEEVGATGEVLLALEDGQIVACAIIRPADDLVAEYGEEAMLPDVERALYFGLAAVRPEHMRSGLGRALVAEAERIAAERGFKYVVLGTLEEFGLVPYYERLGYEVAATIDFEPGHWGITAPHRFAQMLKRL